MYILSVNRDKLLEDIPRISHSCTDAYVDIPCTNNQGWVLPCLSQVSSDGPKDMPGITLSSAYTLYIRGINPDKQSYPMGSRFQMWDRGRRARSTALPRWPGQQRGPAVTYVEQNRSKNVVYPSILANQYNNQTAGGIFHQLIIQV